MDNIDGVLEREEGILTQSLVVNMPEGIYTKLQNEDMSEDYIADRFKGLTPLELTITYTDYIRSNASLKIMRNRALLAIKCSIRVMKRWKEVRVVLIPEFSQTGAFHYHGLISGMTGRGLAELKRQLNLYCGRSEILPVRYPASYIIYMIKDYTPELKRFQLNLNINKN